MYFLWVVNFCVRDKVRAALQFKIISKNEESGRRNGELLVNENRASVLQDEAFRRGLLVMVAQQDGSAYIERNTWKWLTLYILHYLNFTTIKRNWGGGNMEANGKKNSPTCIAKGAHLEKRSRLPVFQDVSPVLCRWSHSHS